MDLSKVVDIYNLDNLKTQIKRYSIKFCFNKDLHKISVDDKCITDHEIDNHLSQKDSWIVNKYNKLKTIDMHSIFKKLDVKLPESLYKIHYKQHNHNDVVNIITKQNIKRSPLTDDIYIDKLFPIFKISLFSRSMENDNNTFFEIIITEVDGDNIITKYVINSVSHYICNDNNGYMQLFGHNLYTIYFIIDSMAFDTFRFNLKHNLNISKSRDIYNTKVVPAANEIKESVKKIKSYELPICINQKDKGILIVDLYYPKLCSHTFILKKIINLRTQEYFTLTQSLDCNCSEYLLRNKVCTDQFFKDLKSCICFIKKNIKRLPEIYIKKSDIYKTFDFITATDVTLFWRF